MKLLHRRKPNRGLVSSFSNFVILALAGAFFFLPMLYTILNAFKPLDELFVYPPRFFVENPTFNNFRDMFLLMSDSFVPISRSFFNTLLITSVGILGQVFIASLAAFILSKIRPPFSAALFKLIVTTLMFSSTVLSLPIYLIVSKLGWIDTYWGIIIPVWGSTNGVFLMKQFMDGLPDSLLESARLDGAGLLRIFWKIVMPNVKPGWITLVIFAFQGLWGTSGGNLIYTETLKPLSYALTQLVSGGMQRAGVSAAVSLLTMIVPIGMFIVTQSNVVETMASSGLKD